MGEASSGQEGPAALHDILDEIARRQPVALPGVARHAAEHEVPNSIFCHEGPGNYVIDSAIHLAQLFAVEASPFLIFEKKPSVA